MEQTKKQPLPIRVISWAYPKVESISRSIAGKWATKLFFTPVPYKIREEEVEFRNTGTSRKVLVGVSSIQTFEWGEGPVILAMHGWSGRGTQFMYFVKEYVSQGYKVVTIDAPAHGQSTGKRTDVLQFARCIEAVSKNYDQIEGLMAHSLGGVAALIAINNGLVVKKLILISVPTTSSLIMSSFENLIHAQTDSTEAIHKYVQNRYNCNLSEFFPPTIKADLTKVKLLVVHDLNDLDVPYAHAELFRDLYPQAKFHFTRGLGHYKILRSIDLVKDSFNFWKNA